MIDTYSVALHTMVEDLKLQVAYRSTDYHSVRLTAEDVARPGLQLAGYFDHFEPMRLQIMGNVEMSYMNKLSPQDRAVTFDRLFSYVLTSEVLGMGLSTLAPNRAGWSRATIAEDFNMLFFERGNHTITFPEGIGVISDEMVRFRQTWPVVGLEFDEAGAILTYKFDENGDLCYMEYETDYDDHTTIFYIVPYRHRRARSEDRGKG